jgi:hypothetical protein
MSATSQSKTIHTIAGDTPPKEAIAWEGEFHGHLIRPPRRPLSFEFIANASRCFLKPEENWYTKYCSAREQIENNIWIGVRNIESPELYGLSASGQLRNLPLGETIPTFTELCWVFLNIGGLENGRILTRYLRTSTYISTEALVALDGRNGTPINVCSSWIKTCDKNLGVLPIRKFQAPTQ